MSTIIERLLKTLGDGPPDDDAAVDAIEALNAARKLIRQIEMGSFRDERGHDLKMNMHYIEAKRMVESEK